MWEVMVLLLLYFSIPSLNNRTDLDWGISSSVMAGFLLEDLSPPYPIICNCKMKK